MMKSLDALALDASKHVAPRTRLGDPKAQLRVSAPQADVLSRSQRGNRVDGGTRTALRCDVIVEVMTAALASTSASNTASVTKGGINAQRALAVRLDLRFRIADLGLDQDVFRLPHRAGPWCRELRGA
jgi:hypothetical protein